MYIQLIILFILLSIFIFTFRENSFKINNIKYWGIGVILILIAGLRPEDSVKDYQNYLEAFYSINNISDTRLEPSFKLIVIFVKEVFNKPIFLFLIFSVVGVSLKLSAIKKITSFHFLALLLYFSYYFMLHEMTQIRAGVASGLLLLSLIPLREGKPLYFFLLAFITFTFHYSALVIFPLWFINPNKNNKLLFASLIPISLILITSGIYLTSFIRYIPLDSIQLLYELRSREMALGTLGDNVNIFNAFFLFRIVVFYFLIFRSSVLSKRNIYFNLLLQIEGISIVTFILFSDFAVVSFRISELLGIVEIILFAEFARSFKPKVMSNIIGISIALLLMYLSIFHIKLINLKI